ncbi:MAG: hypothetical protein BGO21_25615 [Dyadobacter sp. 50-39]|nr:MAG: hypothetical protein BGO21_25615 [Dyadobacter sp. 50-39]
MAAVSARICAVFVQMLVMHVHRNVKSTQKWAWIIAASAQKLAVDVPRCVNKWQPQFDRESWVRI